MVVIVVVVVVLFWIYRVKRFVAGSQSDRENGVKVEKL